MKTPDQIREEIRNMVSGMSLAELQTAKVIFREEWSNRYNHLVITEWYPTEKAIRNPDTGEYTVRVGSGTNNPSGVRIY